MCVLGWTGMCVCGWGGRACVCVYVGGLSVVKSLLIKFQVFHS